ncbi:hypothetical protein [Catenulispora rubra]|uniref:hypothetical protein n=1 Tax=Catenulispora rubra TaxID=280293 RepID=UPI0018927EEC|nr:hypothetical protein [Catenulispora rubra]
MLPTSFIAVLGLSLVVLLLMTVYAAVGPVPRRRVEEFARLHSLRVTVGNGNQIIAYRATTRRWRAAGFTVGVLATFHTGGTYGLAFQWALAGWFAGAAVAELRVAHLDRGPRTSASLASRRAADYLPWAGRRAVPAAMVLCVLTAVFCFARRGSHPEGDIRVMMTWTVAGLGVGAVALAAQRHVLRRPQPLAEPDRMAADDAIRSRSLHVLAAAGMVLVGSCVGSQLAAADVMMHNHVTGMFGALFGIGFPIVGRILAYWPSPPHGSVSGPAAPEAA